MTDEAKELKRLAKKMKELLNGRSVMEIDLGRLEEEWADQAERHRILCRVSTIYGKLLSRAKAELDVAEAQAARTIRKNPDKYGTDGKLTETMVKENVTLNKEYREAADKVIEAKYNQDLADDNVKASDHRKKALENEVSLWSQSYFAKPNTGRLPSEKIKRRLEENADKKAFNKKSR